MAVGQIVAAYRLGIVREAVTGETIFAVDARACSRSVGSAAIRPRLWLVAIAVAHNAISTANPIAPLPRAVSHAEPARHAITSHAANAGAMSSW